MNEPVDLAKIWNGIDYTAKGVTCIICHKTVNVGEQCYGKTLFINGQGITTYVCLECFNKESA